MMTNFPACRGGGTHSRDGWLVVCWNQQQAAPALPAMAWSADTKDIRDIAIINDFLRIVASRVPGRSPSPTCLFLPWHAARRRELSQNSLFNKLNMSWPSRVWVVVWPGPEIPVAGAALLRLMQGRSGGAVVCAVRRRWLVSTSHNLE